MKLKILGSNSSGNCYLLISQTQTLIIEAGVNHKEIMKCLNHNISNVVGCLASHAHMDHFKSAPDLSKRFIDVYSNQEVIDKLGSGYVLQPKTANQIGEFTVYPLRVTHDVETYAFVISHPEMGKLLFCTDAASFPYHINGINHMLIEANYSEDLVTEYALNNTNEFNNLSRLERSHLSLEQCSEIVIRHNDFNLYNIVLIHLSSRNSDDDIFKTTVQEVTGTPVYIAKKGLELNLDIN